MKYLILLIFTSTLLFSAWENEADYQYQIFKDLENPRFQFSETSDTIFLFDSKNIIRIDYKSGDVIKWDEWDLDEYKSDFNSEAKFGFKFSNDFTKLILSFEYKERVDMDEYENYYIVSIDLITNKTDTVYSTSKWLNSNRSTSNYSLLVYGINDTFYRLNNYSYYYYEAGSDGYEITQESRSSNLSDITWNHFNDHIKVYNERLCYYHYDNYEKFVFEGSYDNEKYNEDHFKVGDELIYKDSDDFDLDSNYLIGIDNYGLEYFLYDLNTNELFERTGNEYVKHIRTTNENRVIGFYKDTVKIFTKDNFQLINKSTESKLKPSSKPDLHKKYFIDFRADTLYKIKPNLFLDFNTSVDEHSTVQKRDFIGYYDPFGRLISEKEGVQLNKGLYFKMYYLGEGIISEKIIIK